jgi:hypothetical protein
MMEVTDSSKFKMTTMQGIVQLEIMRSRTDDTGTYKVVAQNDLGKTDMEAIVIVRMPQEKIIEEKKKVKEEILAE